VIRGRQDTKEIAVGTRNREPNRDPRMHPTIAAALITTGGMLLDHLLTHILFK
jgi:hypothetical protein